MYGMVMSRFQKYPEVKSQGLCGLPPLVCFTSDQAHYSIQKGMHWLGFGIDNLIKVKSDDLGRMIPEELELSVEKCIKSGKVPLFVNATVGTTVLGAIDPLNEISGICKKYNIWMHVDGCFGGTLILSKTHRQKLSGVELSDSIAWNPHKMLGAPLQCSLFLTRHKNLMHECNSAAASYLFQQDKHYDVRYDTGDKSIQCGRKVDAFKLWVMWKARGDDGFSSYIDNVIESARYFYEKIKSTPGFRLVIPEIETACICFWYIPTKMRNQAETDSWWSDLYKIAPKIKEKMVREGTLMIGYQPVKNHGNFFRFVITCHPQTTPEDMEYVIKKIIEYGEQV
ncbi:glutamate decarboxylase 2 [Atheta coriaria]|uniref:glutamate decarboxylase 2 n=1 Tax=Dalotia coriaria TaxID=877792 RepID=UPI0031F33A4F